MEKSERVYRSLNREIVANGGGEQNEQRQPRLHQLGEVRHETSPPLSWNSRIDFGRNRSAFHDTGISIETGDWRGDPDILLSRRSRREIADRATPRANMVAPTAT